MHVADVVASPLLRQVPPHSVEAERAVLGSILVGGDVAPIAEAVEPREFYVAALGQVYEAALGLWRSGRPSDVVTLNAELEARGVLDAVGGTAALAELCEAVPSAANGTYYARVVRDHAVRRALIHVAAQVQRDAFTSGGPVGELLERARAGLAEVSTSSGWSDPVPLGEVDLPSFPSWALPGWLRDWVEAESEETETPVDLAGTMALGAVSAALARKLEVTIRHRWREPLNLYLVCVLGPANRKSAVVSAARAPMDRWQADQERLLRDEQRAAEAKRGILESRLDRARKAAEKETDGSIEDLSTQIADLRRELEEFVVPRVPRLCIEDATPERIVGLLEEHGERMAVLSAEGTVFSHMAGRYAKNGGSQLELWLKAHAGEPVDVDRMGRPTQRLRRPSLTLALAVQEDVLQAVSGKSEFRGQGLLGRFLYSVPRSPVGYRTGNGRPMPLDVEAAYARGLTRLLDMTLEPEPRRLDLSRDADAELALWEAELESRMRDGGDLDGMRDWAGKLAGATARLAALLHACGGVGHSWTSQVSAGAVRAAVELGRYYVTHAQVAYREMRSDPALAGAQVVLRWLRSASAGRVSRRDVHRGVRGTLPTAGDVQAALDLLERHGYVRSVEDPARRGPGRPSVLVDVHPEVSNGNPTGKQSS